MSATLQDWERNGWLARHEPTREGVRSLLDLAERDIENSEAEGLGADWRLSIAYNAALQAAAAVLEACGYRAARDAHHYRVIESLRLTMGADDKIVLPLDRLRQKRNIGIYARAGNVSDKEAEAAQRLARKIKDAAEVWLTTNHPELM